MAIRARQNFLSGIISGTITTSTTSLTGTVGSANFPTPAAGYYTPIILNPGYFGATNTTGPEVVFVQPGGSTSVAIVTRGQDGTSATVTGANIPWVAGPIVSDFDVTNLTSTGTLTLNSGLTVQNNGTTTLQRTIVNGYFSSFSGSSLVNPNMYNATVFNGLNTDTLAVNSGSQLYGGIYTNGYFNAQGAGGFQGTLNLFGGLAVQSGNATVNNALTTSGLTVQNNAIISGGLTVNGLSTVLTPPVGDNSTQIASTAFVSTAVASGTNTFTSSLTAGTLSTSSSQLMSLTISGFNKYLITASLTAGNNDSATGHFAYFQINNATASTSSQVMSTYVPAGQRGYIGNSYIVTGVGTGAQNIQLLGYIGGGTAGSVVTLTANAIGLT